MALSAVRIPVWVVSVVLVAACATRPQDCDPGNRDAGMLDKAGCLYSGAYDQRVSTKSRQLQDEQGLNRMFRDTYAALQRETAQVGSELQQQQAQLQQVQQSVGHLLDTIRARSAGNTDVQQQISAVETQLQDMQRAVARAQADNVPLSVMQQRQQMAELQVKVQELEQGLALQ